MEQTGRAQVQMLEMQEKHVLLDSMQEEQEAS